MRTPVTAVIPTYNRRDDLADAIESVLEQRLPHDVQLSVVVVDDCSTDGTAEVLDRYRGRVNVLRPVANGERGAARNLGAAQAQSGFVAFLDSDDRWQPTKLARQLETARDGVVLTGALIEQARSSVPYIPGPDAYNRLLVENQYLAGASSVLLPVRIFRDVGGYPEDRELQGSEDWLFLIKLRAHGHPFTLVPEPLVRYRVHELNSTADPAAVARSMEAAARVIDETYALSQRERSKLHAHVHSVASAGYAARGEWTPALHHAVRALRDGQLAGVTMLARGASGAVRRRLHHSRDRR